MADLYPAVGLGDAPFEISKIPMKCETAVTKGDVVEYDTHTSGELPSVSTTTGASKKVAGVALRSGAAGEVIPVLKAGIVKVTASGAITLGDKVVSAANGAVAASAALDAPATYGEAAMQAELDKVEQRFGVALQTFADGDTGLILLFTR